MGDDFHERLERLVAEFTAKNVTGEVHIYSSKDLNRVVVVTFKYEDGNICDGGEGETALDSNNTVDNTIVRELDATK